MSDESRQRRVPESTPRAAATPAQPVQPVTSPRRRRGVMEQIRIALLVLIGLALLLFILLNYDPVELQLLFWNPELRLAWALLIAAFLGFLAGWLVPKLPSRRR
ncbi:MAG: LapA family protein [Thermomicrobiales bacterium]